MAEDLAVPMVQEDQEGLEVLAIQETYLVVAATVAEAAVELTKEPLAATAATTI